MTPASYASRKKNPGDPFEKLPENLKEILTEEVRTGRLAHAYIFEGPDREAKFECAAALARRINCGEKNSCGACPGCIEAENDSRINLAEGEPEDILPSRTMVFSSATSIGIKYIQKMIKALSMKKPAGMFAVAIIKEGELLTNDAANCMLKMLEEPPERTCIIIISANAESLPATVRSRSQILRFPPGRDIYAPVKYDRQLAARLSTSAAEGRWDEFFGSLGAFLKTSQKKNVTAAAVKRQKVTDFTRALLLDAAERFRSAPDEKLGEDIKYLLECMGQLRKQRMSNIVMERMLLKGAASFTEDGR